MLGGVPAPLTRLGFQISAFDKYLTKPIAMLTHADDRDFLAQLEAVDRFTDNMYAYPGRTFGQLYHVVVRSNALATGVVCVAICKPTTLGRSASITLCMPYGP